MSANHGAVALRVTDLDVSYAGPRRSRVQAVRNASLTVQRGEIVGILGETGSGKSSLARAIVNLTPHQSGTVEIGQQKSGERPLGRRVQMIFQDPRTSLDPSMRILDVVTEPLIFRRGRRHRRERERLAAGALSTVELEPSALLRYSRQFSGGQLQRIAIARGLIVEPELLICDEIVSALDVSTQGSILNLLRRIAAQQNTAMLFISHDVAVLQYLCDRLYVMQHGEILESGPTDQVLNSPTHEFTKTLVDAVPRLDGETSTTATI